MISLDLHMHSVFSDGTLTIEKIVDLCGRAGLDAIAITDHLCSYDHIVGVSAHILNKSLSQATWPSYISEIRKQADRAWREYKMIVYSGVEFTRNTFSHKKNAHLLALDIQEFVSPNLTEEDWLTQVRSLGAITVAAHPLKVKDASSQTYYILDSKEKFEPLIDVWEVANGSTFWRDMLKTKYALSATSDLHIPQKWASWRTKIDCDKDPEAIKAAIKDPSVYRRFAYMFGTKNETSVEIEHRGTKN